MDLSTIPLEARAEAARVRIEEGDDPYVALAAALWPEGMPSFDRKPEMVEGYCVRGHPLNEENTYTRPGGRTACRQCRAFHRRGRYTKKPREKAPCVHCGEPATVARDKGTGGSPTPRCKRCFLKGLKGL